MLKAKPNLGQGMNLLNFWSCHKVTFRTRRYLNEIIGATFVKCLVYANALLSDSVLFTVN